jgi:hypothetical protein
MNSARKSHLKLRGQTTVFGLVLVLAGFAVLGSLIVAASLSLAFLEGHLEA